MELTQAEVKSVEEAAKEASEQQIHALSELQLAFVGGGIGDTAV
jgi:hypothetical protein